MVEAGTKITVAGMITDPNFHKCIAAAQAIEKKGGVEIEVLQFFETQWEEYLRKIASQNKGVFYDHKSSPLVFLNGNKYIGGSEEFTTYALHNYAFLDSASHNDYIKAQGDVYRQRINHSTSKFASLHFNVNGVDSQVVVELFHAVAPKTCDNFLALCKQFKRGDELIGYAQSEVHRIVKGMFIQMGKIKSKNDEMKATLTGGEFPDESFQIRHTQVGLLGMCKRNGLKHTNESQFYITTGAPLTYLDGQNVVFGRVVQGMQTIRLIEQSETVNERPSDSIKVSKTAVYKLD